MVLSDRYSFPCKMCRSIQVIHFRFLNAVFSFSKVRTVQRIALLFKYLFQKFVDITQSCILSQLNRTSYPCGSYYFVDDIRVSADSTTCDIATTINEKRNTSENISVFPNPTSGNATIAYTLPQGETKGVIIIYDIEIAEMKRVEVNNVSSKIE